MNILENILEIYDNLKGIFFTVRIQYKIHIMCKICVNQLLMLSVRLLVNSRLLVVKVLRGQKL